jgi:hypothetical protein
MPVAFLGQFRQRAIELTRTGTVSYRGCLLYCGIVTGKGANLDLQLPGNPAVSEAMNTEGNVYEEVPCKR